MPVRYPLEPLATALGIQLGEPGIFGGANQAGPMPDVAKRLGCSLKTAYRMRADGLSPVQVQRYVVTAGIYPSDIWPTCWADTDHLPDLEHPEIAYTCDDDLACTCDGDFGCTCGYYADDPPSASVSPATELAMMHLLTSRSPSKQAFLDRQRTRRAAFQDPPALDLAA